MSEALECILRRFAEELTAPSTDAMPNRIERMARRYAEEYGSEHDQPCDAIDVLRSIDQLRRDLSGYHGQLKAHNDLQRHCDRQREQLAALGAAHKSVKNERDAYKRQAERLAAENARLRELVRKYGEYTDQDRCEGCACKSRCNDGDVGECWQLTEIRRLVRELGIEV